MVVLGKWRFLMAEVSLQEVEIESIWEKLARAADTEHRN